MSLDFLNTDIQGSDIWHEQRRGKFTSSRFGDLMKNGRGKDTMGDTAWSYIIDTAAEIITGESQGFEGNTATEWGNTYESEAIGVYEKEKGISVERCSFIALNDYVGGTPDGLIGNDGLIEIKCPFKTKNHMKTVMHNSVPSIYEWQLVGNMMVTNRDWCDFITYDPRIPGEKKLHVIRVERDQDKEDLLTQRLELAKTELNKIINQFT